MLDEPLIDEALPAVLDEPLIDDALPAMPSEACAMLDNNTKALNIVDVTINL